MQIILNTEEIEIIYEALITEGKEWNDDLISVKERGRDSTYVEKKIDEILLLKMRMKPYVE